MTGKLTVINPNNDHWEYRPVTVADSYDIRHPVLSLSNVVRVDRTT